MLNDVQLRRFRWAVPVLIMCVTAGFSAPAPTPSPPSHEVEVLRGFDRLVAQQSPVLEENNRVVREVNAEASDEQSAAAITAAPLEAEQSIAAGLGKNLGAIYLEALESGALPQTAAVLGHGKVSTSAAKAVYHYPRPFERNGFESVPGLGDGIRPRLSAEGYAELTGEGSFPSGHTAGAYSTALLLAIMLPELSTSILARAADAGHERLVLGVHYPLDVMAGRIFAEVVIADHLADEEFGQELAQAKAELRGELEARCGNTVARCIAADQAYAEPVRAAVDFEQRLGYGLTAVTSPAEPPAVPEGAQRLLSGTFPHLTPEQRKQVLASTQSRSGAPLDDADQGGSWQRLNLLAALSAAVEVGDRGSLTVNGETVIAGQPTLVEVAAWVGGGVVVVGAAAVFVALRTRRRKHARREPGYKPPVSLGSSPGPGKDRRP